LAGLVPDLDGLSLLRGEEASARWNHLFTHGLDAAVAVSALGAALARDKRWVGGLSFPSRSRVTTAAFPSFSMTRHKSMRSCTGSPSVSSFNAIRSSSRISGAPSVNAVTSRAGRLASIAATSSAMRAHSSVTSPLGIRP
jgi:hypothetical protein